jgi:hypothetical protein
MFCPECGVKNEDRYSYCVLCGAQLEDNQPASSFSAAKSLGAFLYMLRSTTIKTKFALTALVLSAAMLAFAEIGGAVYAPYAIARGFFEAKASGNWGKAYNYLNLEESDLISKKNFTELFREDAPKDIFNYSLAEILVDPESRNSLVLEYAASYVEKGSSKVHTEMIYLVKNKKKKLLLFDDYDVVIDNLVATGATLTAPAYVAASIDGVELEKAYQDESASPIARFTIPPVFTGYHELSLKSEVTDPHAERIEIQSGSKCVAPELYISNNQKASLSETLQSNLLDIISMGLKGAPFEKLNIVCTKNEKYAAAIRKAYEDFAFSLGSDSKVGYTDYKLSYASEGVSQNTLNVDGTFTASLDIIYGYARVSEDSGHFTKEEGSAEGRPEFIYSYEDGSWALFEIRSLGISY